MLLNGLRSSCDAGITCSCRNRRPINCTRDEYDRAIDEAIELTKRGKTIEDQSLGFVCLGFSVIHETDPSKRMMHVLKPEHQVLTKHEKQRLLQKYSI